MPRTTTISTRRAGVVAALGAALALLALLLTPAIGKAQQLTFGVRLDHEPSNSTPAHNCLEDGTDMATPACTRIPLDESIAVAGGLRAPADGTIVKFRVRAGAPGELTFRLVQLQSFSFNTMLGEYRGVAVGAGTGPTVQLQGRGFEETNPVEEFPANLKVRKGDSLGIDSTSNSTLYCSSGGPNQMIFSPTLGATPLASTHTEGCELLVQAVMEPATDSPRPSPRGTPRRVARRVTRGRCAKPIKKKFRKHCRRLRQQQRRSGARK